MLIGMPCQNQLLRFYENSMNFHEDSMRFIKYLRFVDYRSTI